MGGAIANDIHGKNHHKYGSFGNFVNNFQLMKSNGDILHYSENKNQGYFKSTIGGIGLTGVIISAEIKLIKIQSQYIETKTVRYGSLEDYWEINKKAESEFDYTVSWVDCLARNTNGLRGVFHSGNHSNKQPSFGLI